MDAVIFDLGGVVFPSPFGAFAEVERCQGLPAGSIASTIRTAGGDGAWGGFERGELDVAAFVRRFGAEFAAAHVGHALDAAALLRALLRGMGTPRPLVLEAVAALRGRGIRVAALTNNFRVAGGKAATPGTAGLPFDMVVESSAVGMRKPEPAIYRLVCQRLAVEPHRCVFVDDLGQNLKPARALGMRTIKAALDDADGSALVRAIERTVGFPLSHGGGPMSRM